MIFLCYRLDYNNRSDDYGTIPSQPRPSSKTKNISQDEKQIKLCVGLGGKCGTSTVHILQVTLNLIFLIK